LRNFKRTALVQQIALKSPAEFRRRRRGRRRKRAREREEEEVVI